jgi:hypothetical protein
VTDLNKRSRHERKRVPDVDPFAIDPLIMTRLRNRGVSPGGLAIGLSLLFVVTVVLPASLAGRLVRVDHPSTWWNEVVAFVTRGRLAIRAVPYLADFPSIVLTITVLSSTVLVYSLFINVAQLHSDMEGNDCVTYSEEGFDRLHVAVTELNDRFKHFGRYSVAAFGACLAFMAMLNWRLGQASLFPFMNEKDLYPHWWASSQPFQFDAIAWVVLGGLGLYVVYIESILGILYVRFARTSDPEYHFRANLANPDGSYGWGRLRKIITNLELGVVLTAASSWAVSFFLQPAFGALLTVIFLIIFVSVVLGVFVNINASFRRQVKVDKAEMLRGLESFLSRPLEADSSSTSLAQLVAHDRLRMIWSIPASPIRKNWLIAGFLTFGTAVVGLATQVLRYYVSSK